MAKRRTGWLDSSPPCLVEVEQPGQVPVLEDQHQDAERCAHGQVVHQDGLDGKDHRSGHQEEQQQRGGDFDRDGMRQVVAQTGLEVDELCARPADLEVHWCVDGADASNGVER